MMETIPSFFDQFAERSFLFVTDATHLSNFDKHYINFAVAKHDKSDCRQTNCCTHVMVMIQSISIGTNCWIMETYGIRKLIVCYVLQTLFSNTNND